MGLTGELEGCRVYFDTNIFVYLLGGIRELESQIADLRIGLESGGFEAFASNLAVAELLPPLVKGSDRQGIETVLSLFSKDGAFHVVQASRDVFIQAGFIRGRFGMKTPDALHVSFAIEGKCDVFLTNDKGIRCPDPLRRVILSERH